MRTPQGMCPTINGKSIVGIGQWMLQLMGGEGDWRLTKEGVQRLCLLVVVLNLGSSQGVPLNCVGALKTH